MDGHLNSIKERILIEQELLYDDETKCFAEVQKMVDMLKDLEKHLEVLSQIHRSMESLQVKVEKVEDWKSSENNDLDGLPTLKSYDIRLHALDTHECQEIASKFEEKVK